MWGRWKDQAQVGADLDESRAIRTYLNRRSLQRNASHGIRASLVPAVIAAERWRDAMERLERALHSVE